MVAGLIMKISRMRMRPPMLREWIYQRELCPRQLLLHLRRGLMMKRNGFRIRSEHNMSSWMPLRGRVQHLRVLARL